MASGNTLAALDALSSRPPSTNYPQIDLRNGHAVLDFDDTTDETTRFALLLPSNFSGGDLLVRLAWTSTAATSGAVAWQAAAELQPSGFDLDADGFGAAASGSGAAPSNAGELVVTTITVSPGGSQAAGDHLRLRVSRLATDAGDTMTGDAELYAVEVREA